MLDALKLHSSKENHREGSCEQKGAVRKAIAVVVPRSGEDMMRGGSYGAGMKSTGATAAMDCRVSDEGTGKDEPGATVVWKNHSYCERDKCYSTARGASKVLARNIALSLSTQQSKSRWRLGKPLVRR